MRDRYLTRADMWVNVERDEVTEAIDGAAKEVGARAKIGDGGGSKGFNRGVYRLRLNTDYGAFGGD